MLIIVPRPGVEDIVLTTSDGPVLIHPYISQHGRLTLAFTMPESVRYSKQEPKVFKVVG